MAKWLSEEDLQKTVKRREARYINQGGVKMAEEQDGEITFSSTNSSKEQQNGEQSLQNNF